MIFNEPDYDHLRLRPSVETEAHIENIVDVEKPMDIKCLTCGARMIYTADAIILDDGSHVRDCICEKGHEFIERVAIHFKQTFF